MTQSLDSTLGGGFVSSPQLFAVPTDRDEPVEVGKDVDSAAIPIRENWRKIGPQIAIPDAPPVWGSSS